MQLFPYKASDHFIISMSTTKTQVPRGGRYCVGGGPGGISCKNSSHTPGVMLHKFPSEKTRAEERKLWTKFVRRHRPNFYPTAHSVLCSAHFEASCYPQCYSIDVPEHLRPKVTYLKPEAIPTIDTVVPLEPTPNSGRGNRMVLTRFKIFFDIICTVNLKLYIHDMSIFLCSYIIHG